MRITPTAALAALLLTLGVSTSARAQTSYLTPNQPLTLAWDFSGSTPPEDKYKVRLLAQSSPAGVTITEIVTPTAGLTFDVPWTSLPDQQFWVSVRALRTVTMPGESTDSNVIGPFTKPTLKAPAGLRRVTP